MGVWGGGGGGQGICDKQVMGENTFSFKGQSERDSPKQCPDPPHGGMMTAASNLSHSGTILRPCDYSKLHWGNVCWESV